MSTRRLAELTAPDAAERIGADSSLVLPVGAIEQHGPHLPLATDLIIAEAVADAVVESAGDELDLWLLPALAYSKSDEHHWAPGSVWLSAATFLTVVDEIAVSLATLPARRLVFLNGHGGNSSLLGVALREVRRRHGLMTFLVHPSTPVDQGGASDTSELGMGVHAGHEETSLMLHLRPDTVVMERARRHVPEALADNEFVRFGGGVPFGWTSDDFGPSGVIGDPTGASAAAGAAMFPLVVERVTAALREISTFEFDRFQT
jgi:creatinine amidohydrolase